MGKQRVHNPIVVGVPTRNDQEPSFIASRSITRPYGVGNHCFSLRHTVRQLQTSSAWYFNVSTETFLALNLDLWVSSFNEPTTTRSQSVLPPTKAQQDFSWSSVYSKATVLLKIKYL
jgi:hypothetical protein